MKELIELIEDIPVPEIRPAVKTVSARSNRSTPLTNLLRRVMPTLPDIVGLPASADSTSNLVDMAISASRLCLRRDRESLAFNILKESLTLDGNALPVYFLAWQVGGNSALESLGTNPLSQQVKEFVQRLEDGCYQNVLDDLSTHPFTANRKPRLVITLSTDLCYMDLFTRLGDTTYFLGRINNPELAVSLNQARKEFLPSAYALLEHLVKLGKDTRTYYYSDTKIQVYSSNIFGPTIDTFFFIKVLHEFIDNHSELSRSDCIVELGAGSGAILYTLAQRLAGYITQKRIHAIVTDISEHAISHSEKLFSDLVEREKSLLTAILDGDSLKRIKERYGPGSVDILIVNPPYIPTSLLKQLSAGNNMPTSVDFDNAIDEYILSVHPRSGAPTSSEEITRSATEDLDLYIQALLTEGPDLLISQTGIMFLLASSTSEEIIRLLFDRSTLSAVILDHRVDVPLEIPELTSGALRAELMDLSGVSFHATDGRYPLRHALTVYALFHPQSIWATKLRGLCEG